MINTNNALIQQNIEFLVLQFNNLFIFLFFSGKFILVFYRIVIGIETFKKWKPPTHVQLGKVLTYF